MKLVIVEQYHSESKEQSSCQNTIDAQTTQK